MHDALVCLNTIIVRTAGFKTMITLNNNNIMKTVETTIHTTTPGSTAINDLILSKRNTWLHDNILAEYPNQFTDINEITRDPPSPLSVSSFFCVLSGVPAIKWSFPRLPSHGFTTRHLFSLLAVDIRDKHSSWYSFFSFFFTWPYDGPVGKNWLFYTSWSGRYTIYLSLLECRSFIYCWRLEEWMISVGNTIFWAIFYSYLDAPSIYDFSVLFFNTLL